MSVDGSLTELNPLPTQVTAPGYTNLPVCIFSSVSQPDPVSVGFNNYSHHLICIEISEHRGSGVNQ